MQYAGLTGRSQLDPSFFIVCGELKRPTETHALTVSVLLRESYSSKRGFSESP
jgi:hypothetical protein